MNDRIETSRWQSLGMLFEQAIGLDAAEQAALLRTAEREDAELARALASLLAADARHQDRTAEHRERMLRGSLYAIDSPDIEIGDRVGPYVVREGLGRGGMGAVFLAERADGQVRQQVALKVVKRSLLDASGRERFLREREIVAAFQHPYIARMLDVGETRDGSPYLAMELIRGLPITGYCDAHKRDMRGRIEVFTRVCEAVQHAHANLVLHRDLKPSNVLVGDDGLPKLIDFGIAKPLGMVAEDELQQTATAQRYFSRSNVAPEQLRGERVGVACDVYQLGTLLHELLCGAQVFDAALLTPGQFERHVFDVTPEMPSARAVRASQVTAQAHGVGSPALLARALQGELDWIVMKALEKEPARRYETANALEMDLRRYLSGEPVLAAPPSALYRMQKFVRRNKGSVAAVSLVTAALLVGIVGFAWQARIARQQTVLAQEQTRLALQRTHELEVMERFETSMLVHMDPTRAGDLLSDDVQAKFKEARVRAGVSESERASQFADFAAQWRQINATDAARDLIDGAILKPAVAMIDKQFKNQPELDAALRQTLADRYAGMGLYDAALPLQESALATRRKVLGPDHPDTLDSLYGMGGLLERMARPAQAEPYAMELLRRTRRVYDKVHDETLEALSLMGLILYDDGRLAEAETYYREALTVQRLVLGDDDPETLSQIHNLGLLLMYQHKLVEAEPFLREAEQKSRRVLGEADPSTLLAICNLGYLLEREGRLDEAGKYEDEALTKARHALGENHPITLIAVILSGMVLEKKGEHAAAEKLLAPVSAATLKVFTGSNLFLRGTYLTLVGLARTGEANYAAAETALLEAHSILQQTHNVTHLDDIRDCTRAIVALYASWNKAEPGNGYEAKETDWKRKLDALDAPTRSEAVH